MMRTRPRPFGDHFQPQTGGVEGSGTITATDERTAIPTHLTYVLMDVRLSGQRR
jgi:hypothetical protein